MSESKFTKGEWSLNATDFYGEFDLTTQERIEDSKVAILTIDTSYSGYIGDEQKANAHLIAAAPEMYELIKEFLDYADPCHPISDMANKLLAKARGEK
ncbi:hypothetical protein MYOV065v1_p0027 [Vibrio phage PS15B.2]|nr:hypothetical protein MYOV065v1_p0027 [Vibrio phage PS15B.2]QZI90835.1 hypothetical protein MYOV066v1_p0057 [Vibrio phage PS15B.3]QZI90877.1 hypothetical protein MYOV064v1_p0027 [Vibrio phage PS15B.4]